MNEPTKYLDLHCIRSIKASKELARSNRRLGSGQTKSTKPTVRTSAPHGLSHQEIPSVHIRVLSREVYTVTYGMDRKCHIDVCNIQDGNQTVGVSSDPGLRSEFFTTPAPDSVGVAIGCLEVFLYSFHQTFEYCTRTLQGVFIYSPLAVKECP